MVKLNKKGFTLAELLIVVAVIAVLVAVAIPTFSSQLEKSRQGVDISNLRGAYAAARIAQMDRAVGTQAIDDTHYQFWYDPDTGNLQADKPDAYGKAAAKELVADTSGLNEAVTYKGGTGGQLPTANTKAILVTFAKYDGTYVIQDISFKSEVATNVTAPTLLMFKGTGDTQMMVPTLTATGNISTDTDLKATFDLTPATGSREYVAANDIALTLPDETSNVYLAYGTTEDGGNITARGLKWGTINSGTEADTTIYVTVTEKTSATGNAAVKTYLGKVNLKISNITS